MALEAPVASQASTGYWLITAVPAASNALSVAILTGGTAKTLTYSFTPDGFNRTIAQNEVEDKRLTMAQILTRPGNYKETLEVKYVESTDSNAAAVVLAEGTPLKLVIRRGISNATAWTIGQKVDVITIVPGKRRPDAPTENGIDTFSQTLFVTDISVDQGTLVA